MIVQPFIDFAEQYCVRCGERVQWNDAAAVVVEHDDGRLYDAVAHLDRDACKTALGDQ